MKLYRAFATVGGLTMISRVLGFVRDVLIANVLGTGAIAEAFFAAFRLPNLFRRLFAEGAFNAAFVPLFSGHLERSGPEGARAFAQEAIAALLFVLLALTIVAQIAMPGLVYLMTPGFAQDPAKFDLTVLLSRITFPYLLCMSLVALFSGMLNALDRFIAAAAAPIILNIGLIGALVLGALYLDTRTAGVVLAWGVALSGGLQLAVLAWAAQRQGMGLAIRWPRLTPGVKRLVTLGIPGVISGGITQINLLIGTMIASLQAGAIAYLYYADRIYQLPLGVVGIAIGIVLLPAISRQLRSGDFDGVADSQNRSVEFALLLTVPASIALLAVPDPIIRVLFEYGAFTAADTRAVADALAAFAIGLPAFVLIKVFSPAYFAREDTRTPMIFAGVSVIVNIALSLMLFFGFQALGISPHIGIAIGTTAAGWVNAVLLWATLVRRGHYRADAGLARSLPRIALASVVMGSVVFGLAYLMGDLLAAGAHRGLQIAALAGLVGAGIVVYAGLAHLTGAVHLPSLLRGRTRPA
ncbi:MAG: murein biosynthesis integral membrane protein MurJ [Pseudomonadota bacterium]